jgi:hypothetical protein
MPVTAESMQRLVRAYSGAHLLEGLVFWLALAHNVNGLLAGTGHGGPRTGAWIVVGAIVSAGTVGSYYRWRFGRMTWRAPEVAMRPFERLSYSFARAVMIVLGLNALILLMALILPMVAGGRPIGVKPAEIGWLMASTWGATSLARSRGERFAWLVPLLGSTVLLLTLMVPALQEYRAAGHAAMISALVVTAVQLHRCLVREFRNAEV